MKKKRTCMALKRSTRATRRRTLDRENLVTPGREPSDSPPGSQLSRIRTQRHSIYKTILSGFQACLSAQPTPLGKSLGRSNQRGSKTFQACNGHPRCNLNLVRLSHLSLPLPFTDAFSSSPTHAAAPFAYGAVPNPRVMCGGATVTRDAK